MICHTEMEKKMNSFYKDLNVQKNMSLIKKYINDDIDHLSKREKYI